MYRLQRLVSTADPGGAVTRFTEKFQNKINEAAPRVLQRGEQVLDGSSGQLKVVRMGSETTRKCLILVTDRRVILYTKKLGGYEMNDHVYGLLTAVDYKKGMVFGNLTLAASGDRTHISQIPKDDVERVVKSIRDQIARASRPAGQYPQQVERVPVPGASTASDQGPRPLSVADELGKLAGLHAAGVLTDAEFAEQKQRLLRG